MQQLMIKDMYLGKIDGYNEFLEYGQSTCKELFFEFPTVSIDKILDGSIYYIVGNKGTGKTMLLKYIESKILENEEINSTQFIRFKKDVDAEQRNQLKRVAVPTNCFEEIIESNIPTDSTLNCTIAWQIYLIKVIISRLSQTEYGVFDRIDDNWIKLCSLLKVIYGENSSIDQVKKVLPKIKRGNIELNFAKLAKINVEFEWIDSTKKIVSFSSIANQIIFLYKKLKPVENTIYILIDELELSLKKNKDYQRDITLIRDLILAVEALNEINRTQKYSVYIVAAIRNEVYKNIISKGMEINKVILDFGVTIAWEQKGGNIRNHPLLKMLEKRIRYSEKLAGLKESSDIWDKYFVPSIGDNKLSIENYLLDQTWYKPRDIIRLFSIIQKQFGNKTFFDQEIFDSIRKTYAEESWVEFEEVLTSKYFDDEVEGIKKSLTGLSLPFELTDFINNINKNKDFFEEVNILEKNKKLPEILKDLYEIGVIGNYAKNASRFSFKGDVDISPSMPMTIHYPLIRFFKASLSSKRKY